MVSKFPTSLIQGETFTAEFTLDAASVAVYLRGPASKDLTASLVNGVWTATADTGGGTPWAHGDYTWEAWATLADGSKSLITRQSLEVVRSVLNGGTDVNQYDQIVVAIEGFLASNGSDPTWKRYRIGQREIERYSMTELMQMLAYYKRLAAQDRRRRRGLSLLGPDIRFRI